MRNDYYIFNFEIKDLAIVGIALPFDLIGFILRDVSLLEPISNYGRGVSIAACQTHSAMSS